MPASRSARAMTLAPRSWPSRPGLAMTTRIFCIWQLDERNFFVLAPHVPERVAHLADGRVGADAVHQGIHRIPGAARRLLERVERGTHPGVVARLPQRLEPGELPLGGGLVDVEDRNRR